MNASQSGRTALLRAMSSERLHHYMRSQSDAKHSNVGRQKNRLSNNHLILSYSQIHPKLFHCIEGKPTDSTIAVYRNQKLISYIKYKLEIPTDKRLPIRGEGEEGHDAAHLAGHHGAAAAAVLTCLLQALEIRVALVY